MAAWRTAPSGQVRKQSKHCSPTCRNIANRVIGNRTGSRPKAREAHRERLREAGRPVAPMTEARIRHDRFRKAKMSAPGADRIRPLVVFERDGWVCWLCEEPIDRSLRHPDPMSASVDHVVPLARDGEHVYENVRAAHLTCNVRRRARLVA